jgi:hypothetical protein
MLGGLLQAGSTSVSQNAVSTLTTYISLLDEKMPQLIDQSKDKLVGMMLNLVNESREANKVVYVRFLEVSV